MSKPECDGASVGVLVEQAGKLLVFERALPPVGVAPPAGHVYDEHTDYRAAAYAEVREETGLQVVELEFLTGGWRVNGCWRAPGPSGAGHQWEVFRATVTGDLDPSPSETRNARWATRTEVQELAERTIAYVEGRVSDGEFEERPGLEPVWLRWLNTAGWITVADEDLDEVEAMLEHRAMRSLTGVPVEITFRHEDGGSQTLWGECTDWDHLARLQELIDGPEADQSVIILSARLTRNGTDYPRAFRASRTTLREIDLAEE